MNLAFTAIGTGISVIATDHVINGILPTPNLIEDAKNVYKQISDNFFNANKLAARASAGALFDFDKEGKAILHIQGGEQGGILETTGIATGIGAGRVDNVVALTTENAKENAVTAGVSAMVLGGLALVGKATGLSWLPALTIPLAPVIRAATYMNGDLKVLSFITESKKQITDPTIGTGSLIRNALAPAISALGVEDSKIAETLITKSSSEIKAALGDSGNAAVRNNLVAKAMGWLEGQKIGLRQSVLSPFAGLAEAGQNALSAFIVRPNNIESNIATA